jgi:hypothetical protein
MKNRRSFILSLVLLAFLNSHNLLSQKSSKEYYRNDRFVFEFTKKTLPGENYVITGCKLHEFFDGKLVHSDTSQCENIVKTCKHFLTPEHCVEGNYDPEMMSYYFPQLLFGSSVNQLPTSIMYLDDYREYIVSEGPVDIYGFQDEQSVNKLKVTRISIPDTTVITRRIDDQSLEMIRNQQANKGKAIKDAQVSRLEIHSTFNPLTNSFDKSMRTLSAEALKENEAFDINGNVYSTVNISGQVWMAENLKSTSFQNGEQIRRATSLVEWSALNSPALSQGFESEYMDSSLGYFYNGFTVVDERNACPFGFHPPTRSDVAGLYNRINTDGQRIRIKRNGVAVHKRYPRIFSPVIVGLGIGLTGAAYGIAGVADVVGNLVWTAADLFLLGPFIGWKKQKTYALDPQSKKVSSKTKIVYRACPTTRSYYYRHRKSWVDSLRITGAVLTDKQIREVNETADFDRLANDRGSSFGLYSLVAWLADEGFHLILTPGNRLDREDYSVAHQGDYESGASGYSHLDRLKVQDGHKLTNEFGFNLAPDNGLLFSPNNYMTNQDGYYEGMSEEEYYSNHGVDFYYGSKGIYPSVLPFTNGSKMLLWGNMNDHEIQQADFLQLSLFPNRNGVKVRCIKD